MTLVQLNFKDPILSIFIRCCVHCIFCVILGLRQHHMSSGTHGGWRNSRLFFRRDFLNCAHFLRRSLSFMLASVIGMFVSGVLRYFFPSHHCASRTVPPISVFQASLTSPEASHTPACYCLQSKNEKQQQSLTLGIPSNCRSFYFSVY